MLLLVTFFQHYSLSFRSIDKLGHVSARDLRCTYDYNILYSIILLFFINCRKTIAKNREQNEAFRHQSAMRCHMPTDCFRSLCLRSQVSGLRSQPEPANCRRIARPQRPSVVVASETKTKTKTKGGTAGYVQGRKQ